MKIKQPITVEQDLRENLRQMQVEYAKMLREINRQPAGMCIDEFVAGRDELYRRMRSES